MHVFQFKNLMNSSHSQITWELKKKHYARHNFRSPFCSDYSTVTIESRACRHCLALLSGVSIIARVEHAGTPKGAVIKAFTHSHSYTQAQKHKHAHTATRTHSHTQLTSFSQSVYWPARGDTCDMHSYTHIVHAHTNSTNSTHYTLRFARVACIVVVVVVGVHICGIPNLCAEHTMSATGTMRMHSTIQAQRTRRRRRRRLCMCGVCVSFIMCAGTWNAAQFCELPHDDANNLLNGFNCT